MDGVLFDSMPRHAIAWEEVMKIHGLPFTAYDCYVNEGRTGESGRRRSVPDVQKLPLAQLYIRKVLNYHWQKISRRLWKDGGCNLNIQCNNSLHHAIAFGNLNTSAITLRNAAADLEIVVVWFKRLCIGVFYTDL